MKELSIPHFQAKAKDFTINICNTKLQKIKKVGFQLGFQDFYGAMFLLGVTVPSSQESFQTGETLSSVVETKADHLFKLELLPFK